MFHRLRKQKPFMPHNRREPSKGPQYIGSLISCIVCLFYVLRDISNTSIIWRLSDTKYSQTKPTLTSNQSVSKVFFIKQTLINISNLSFDFIEFHMNHIEVITMYHNDYTHHKDMLLKDSNRNSKHAFSLSHKCHCPL